jgi:uncharacterized damage-inducible protein DinB
VPIRLGVPALLMALAYTVSFGAVHSRAGDDMDSTQAQFLAKSLCALWEGEFPATCKVIAAVPDAKRDYRPDEKSRTAWELATHIATADIWFINAILAGSFVFDPAAEKQQTSQFSNVADVVSFYKKEFPAALNRIREMAGDTLAAPVDFFGIMKMPNVTYVGFANNHSIHHRGQLAAYLRAMGSKVPAIYGASADEPMPG